MHFLAFLNQAQTLRRFHHIARGASLSRRHQDTEKTSRPERRHPHSNDTATIPPNSMLQNGVRILAFDGFKRMSSVIKYQDFMPDPSDLAPLNFRLQLSHLEFLV
jgi:hypothetical protein